MTAPVDPWEQWFEAVDTYATFLRAAASSPGTIRLRRHYLVSLAAAVAPSGPWEVAPDQLVGYLGRAHWQPETRKSARAAVRSFYRWAEDTGRVELDPARRLPAVRVPATVPRPAPEDLVLDALERADERERVMVLLAATAGLRCAEIAQVHTRDVVAGALRVRGKGGRVRSVPLQPDVVDALSARPRGWAFPGQIDGHLSPATVSKLLQRLLGPGWSGHKLRHRMASRAYAGSRDLLAVQRLLGHSRPETTTRYVLVPEDSLLAAAAFAAAPTAAAS